MANVKITGLPVATQITGSDLIAIVSGSVETQQATFQQVLDYVSSSTFNTGTFTDLVVEDTINLGPGAIEMTDGGVMRYGGGGLISDGGGGTLVIGDGAASTLTVGADPAIITTGLTVNGTHISDDLTVSNDAVITGDLTWSLATGSELIITAMEAQDVLTGDLTWSLATGSELIITAMEAQDVLTSELTWSLATGSELTLFRTATSILDAVQLTASDGTISNNLQVDNGLGVGMAPGSVGTVRASGLGSFQAKKSGDYDRIAFIAQPVAVGDNAYIAMGQAGIRRIRR